MERFQTKNEDIQMSDFGYHTLCEEGEMKSTKRLSVVTNQKLALEQSESGLDSKTIKI